VKKKKSRIAASKKSPAKRVKPSAAPNLKNRLDAEFATAVVSAKTYIGNPSRMRELFNEAAKEAATMPREPFGDTWPYFQAMLRLIRAYYRGEYRDVATSTLLVIVAAVVYVVNPLDLIPDWVPGLGLLDDAFIVAFAVRQTKQSLDDFMSWETTGA